MSCCTAPLLPSAKMLTLSQVTTLVKTSSPAQDGNNNVLKMMSSRCSLSGRAPPRLAGAQVVPAGPKRCLFGAPSPADTQRLLREDEDAVKARMAHRWGWDLNREGPTVASKWQWETMKGPRRHPYAIASSRPGLTTTPVPVLLSPLAATPSEKPGALDTSATSSSSGTSTLWESPASPCLASPRQSASPTAHRAEAEDTESDSADSCCGDSYTSSSGATSPRAENTVPVQTRITDFWRTRRCSVSEGVAKNDSTVPAPSRTSPRTCSV